MNAQEIVAANVAARGYMAGWTAEQFVARQLAKLTEELSEALACMRDPGWHHYWTDDAHMAGRMAREDFDRKMLWDTVEIDTGALRAELADMQVVLFAAAQTLEFDIAQAAIDKSGADVERGVR
jgi:NTP pyrophosphatase (non-canonical NTP hydrolase)